MLTAPNIADVYSVFEVLTQAGLERFGGALGGKLVLYALLDEMGAAISLGSSIAGAASLGIDPDAERLKGALRGGVCDFVVNGLDEALRILKNEIRKQQPVSVGLIANVEACLREMMERGVQPDLVAPSLKEYQASFREFAERGAYELSADQTHEGNVPSAASASGERREGLWWSVAGAPAQWLPKVDALVAEVVAAGQAAGDERLRWLAEVPRYLVRPQAHYVKLSPVEADQFMDLVSAQRRSGTLEVEVTIRRAHSRNSGAVLTS